MADTNGSLNYSKSELEELEESARLSGMTLEKYLKAIGRDKPKAVEVEEEPDDSSSALQDETKTKISASLKKHKGSFFAEENVADDLRLALDGTDWAVTESNVMGRGGINAISLKSEGGASKTFNLGGDKDVSQEMISFINSNPKKSPEYVADKEAFMSSMDGYYTPAKIKELTNKDFLADLDDEDDFKEAIKDERSTTTTI